MRRIGWAKATSSSGAMPGGRHVHGPPGDVLVAGQRRHAEVVQEAVEEGLVLGRQAGGHAGGVEAAVVGAHVLLGQQQVDAERRAARFLADPGQVVVELLGGVGHGAEHAEAAGAAHRRHDVSAVAEGEDRELDPQQVLDPGVHGQSVAPRQPPRQMQLGQNSMTRRPRVPPASSRRCASLACSGGKVAATRSVTAPSSTCWRSRSSLACSFR